MIPFMIKVLNQNAHYPLCTIIIIITTFTIIIITTFPIYTNIFIYIYKNYFDIEKDKVSHRKYIQETFNETVDAVHKNQWTKENL